MRSWAFSTQISRYKILEVLFKVGLYSYNKTNIAQGSYTTDHIDLKVKNETCINEK